MRIIPEKHDREKLIVMKTWEQLFEEADRGDIKALELCTSYCIQGDDETSPDLSKALHYALLIEENGGDSSPYFTWIYTLQKDYKHAYHAYKVAFMRGHLEQMGEMALVCYHLGKFEEAYQYAGNTKEWQGAFVLGLLYENGNYVAANREMAHTYYSRAYRISNDPAAGEGVERTRSMDAPATSHVFRNVAIVVSVLIVIITAGVLIDNNAKREKAKRLAQQEREEYEKKQEAMIDELSKESEERLDNFIQGKPQESQVYNDFDIFQGGDSSSSSSSSDSYSTYENDSDVYEESEVDNSLEDIDVEELVLDIRETYNSIVSKISKGSYRKVTTEKGATAYYKGDKLKALAISKNQDGSKYSRWLYYKNDNLMFAYYEGKDAQRLYFKDNKLIRWRRSSDAKKAAEAVNHDKEWENEQFVKWETKALNDSNTYQ